MNDYRFQKVKFLIEHGQITTIQDICKFIPKTVVLRIFRVNFGRFNQALANPAHFRLEELKTLADLFGVDAKILVDMAYGEVAKGWKRKRGRPRKELPKPNEAT